MRMPRPPATCAYAPSVISLASAPLAPCVRTVRPSSQPRSQSQPRSHSPPHYPRTLRTEPLTSNTCSNPRKANFISAIKHALRPFSLQEATKICTSLLTVRNPPIKVQSNDETCGGDETSPPRQETDPPGVTGNRGNRQQQAVPANSETPSSDCPPLQLGC